MEEIDLLKEMTHNIRILYVEDDENLRRNTREFLNFIFDKMDIAENGKAGLESYEKTRQDLIITDIKMPVMDGLEMVEKIKAINPQQKIIVTSAYGDESTLLKLIDMGVSRFISKPFFANKFTSVLFETCRIISDKKIEDLYQKKIEETNLELAQKNQELQKSVRVLETKLQQIARQQTFIKKNQQNAPSAREQIPEPLQEARTESPLDNEKMIVEDIDEIIELENDIDYIISSATLKNSIDDKDILKLSEKLIKYGNILMRYYYFVSLGSNIIRLGDAFHHNIESTQKKFSLIISYAESFIFVLIKWRQNIVEETTADLNTYDASIGNDVDMITAYLEDRENEFENEMKFF